MTAGHLGSEAHAVPPLDDDLAGCLEDIQGVHAGITLIADGLKLLALSRLTADETQTVIATLAGSAGADVVSACGHLIARLTSHANVATRHMPREQAKQVQHRGEVAQFHLLDPDLHQPASEASAAITGT
ncbi:MULTISPECIES: hypothetical protein [Streptomyces]|uniref:hypothetical protein n=1 Tax=Streptomyces TaxID=1883 RepID=UPI0036E6A943